jgi:hypothetical protein
MAALTLQRNSSRVRILMTGDTGRTDALEKARFAMPGRKIRGSGLVTGDAHDGYVFARQRELGALVRKPGDREMRRLDRVTRFADGTELTEVDVMVARHTLLGRRYKPDSNRTRASG